MTLRPPIPSSLVGPQQFRRQGPRQRPLLPHRLLVEPRHRLARGGERAFDPRRHVSDEAFVDRELAVGKELDQHGAQQRSAVTDKP